MPVVTEAGEEAVVTAWFVDEGQACSSGQLIAEVQAEKVSAEVFAPQDGFVVNRVAISDPIPQGSPVCSVSESALVQDHMSSAVPVAAVVKASPAAKRLGRELGIDLGLVTGTGPEGRITEDDVRRISPEPDSGGLPLSGLRSVIARNMRQSHAETAPVTLFQTAHFGLGRPQQLTARAVKASAEALLAHPEINGTRIGDVFTESAQANVAVAIQTDDGLVAPVIQDASSFSVGEIADVIRVLAERAQTKSLDGADYQGGTFTVTNLGSLGIDTFTPIINLPQVAILGMGALNRVPILDAGGNLAADHQVTLSLTFDHAFVDGDPAARFLNEIVTRMAGE